MKAFLQAALMPVTATYALKVTPIPRDYWSCRTFLDPPTDLEIDPESFTANDPMYRQELSIWRDSTRTTVLSIPQHGAVINYGTSIVETYGLIGCLAIGGTFRHKDDASRVGAFMTHESPNDTKEHLKKLRSIRKKIVAQGYVVTSLVLFRIEPGGSSPLTYPLEGDDEDETQEIGSERDEKDSNEENSANVAPDTKGDAKLAKADATAVRPVRMYRYSELCEKMAIRVNNIFNSPIDEGIQDGAHDENVSGAGEHKDDYIRAEDAKPGEKSRESNDGSRSGDAIEDERNSDDEAESKRGVRGKQDGSGEDKACVDSFWDGVDEPVESLVGDQVAQRGCFDSPKAAGAAVPLLDSLEYSSDDSQLSAGQQHVVSTVIVHYGHRWTRIRQYKNYKRHGDDRRLRFAGRASIDPTKAYTETYFGYVHLGTGAFLKADECGERGSPGRRWSLGSGISLGDFLKRAGWDGDESREKEEAEEKVRSSFLFHH